MCRSPGTCVYLGFFPRYNSARWQCPYSVYIECMVLCERKYIKTPWLWLYWMTTPVTQLYLLHMPHTHGKNGVCILAFAETRPPASNYFTTLNAFTAKPFQRPVLSFSPCRTWFHFFMSLKPFLSSQRCLECNSQSLNVALPLLSYYSNLCAKCHGTDYS